MSAVTIAFCLDDERDRDLVSWLNSHKGSRSALIRETLRLGLGQDQAITVRDIRQALRAELDLCYALQRDDSGVSTASPEPEQAAAHLDGLEERLNDWEGK